MVQKITREMMADKAVIHAVPPVAPVAHEVNRTFELPTALYVATVLLFLGFLASMVLAFGNPALIIPMALFTFFIIMGFGVPTVWATMRPAKQSKAKSWARFQREGVMTPFGRADAGAATVQVLILPALIFLWGVAIVVIAALVR